MGVAVCAAIDDEVELRGAVLGEAVADDGVVVGEDEVDKLTRAL